MSFLNLFGWAIHISNISRLIEKASSLYLSLNNLFQFCIEHLITILILLCRCVGLNLELRQHLSTMSSGGVGYRMFGCSCPYTRKPAAPSQTVPGQSLLPNVRVEIRPIPCCHGQTGLLLTLLLTDNSAVRTIIKTRTPWEVGTLWHVKLVK